MSEAAILLVDDHAVVREGYRRLLERVPGCRVVAEAPDIDEAYRLYKIHRPDLVLMDLSMPGPGGLHGVGRIRLWDRTARILVVSMHDASSYARKAFEAGASGYVTKASGGRELVRAVAAVLAGDRALSPDMAEILAQEQIVGAPSALADLAPRETEILRLLARGWTDAAIAEALNLSLKTVRNYHYGIKQKIGAENDAHLVWLAVGAGLIEGLGNGT